MAALLNQRSGSLLATIQMSIIRHPHQGVCALEADRKQRHSKDGAALCACGPHEGRD